MGELLQELILRVPVILLALTVHEFAHAYSAYRLGDPTAMRQGRCSLNPIRHLDPIGTICLLFAPIGWAKPVPVNPMNFRNPSRDDMIVSIAGPASNIAQAVVFALLLRGLVAIVAATPTAVLVTVFNMLVLAILINIGLAIFNMLPIFPLDGFHVLRHFLPASAREKLTAMAPLGPMLILAVVLLPRFGGFNLFKLLIAPVANVVLYYVAGVHFTV